MKFEQNRTVRIIQNFELFDEKWLTIFDKVLTPFWKTFLSGVATGWHGWTMSRGPELKGAPERDKKKKDEE